MMCSKKLTINFLQNSSLAQCLVSTSVVCQTEQTSRTGPAEIWTSDPGCALQQWSPKGCKTAAAYILEHHQMFG